MMTETSLEEWCRDHGGRYEEHGRAYGCEIEGEGLRRMSGSVIVDTEDFDMEFDGGYVDVELRDGGYRIQNGMTGDTVIRTF